MSVKTTTHLNFRGEARAALDFYHAVFGGDQVIVTYGDAHMPQETPDANQVMWGQVTALSGFSVMAYDVQTRKSWNPGQNAFYVALMGDSAEEITGYWEKLSEGATIEQPLGPSPWAPLYGMLKDQFGVTWIVSMGGDDSGSEPAQS